MRYEYDMGFIVLPRPVRANQQDTKHRQEQRSKALARAAQRREANARKGRAA